jgi:hypothetical protein
MDYLYIVGTKGKLITVRAAEDVRQDFKIAADLRGATASSLLYQFIVRTIREEKAENPSAFGTQPKRKAPGVATISPGRPTKSDIRRQVIGDDVDDLGTVDYTDQMARTAERVRLSLLKADTSPDDADGFRKAFEEATQEAGERIAKKRKAKN